MLNLTYILIILLLPFGNFLLLGIGSRKIPQPLSGWLATLSLLVAASLSLLIAYEYFVVTGPNNGVYPSIELFRYPWLVFGTKLTIEMSWVLDSLTIMMLVVVTLISAMVHLFSLGYMKGEGRYTTYYAFLGLFTFSMLGLILAGNLFQIYIFWELVGVSSFLLIGYYFTKPTAIAAAKKAFIVTRFADLGFLIGILIISFYGETLDIATLIERLTNTAGAQSMDIQTAQWMGISALTWGLALLFIGGAGKSAMFPLHIWLPDAMEGPTPVSALIHAATMVVAGVYLVARLFPVFQLSESILQLVTYTGIFSAFFAAIIACTQTDIKRVLAYSTMSQIGYMMFSLGIARGEDQYLGYTASLFHLFTHAFFKSLLFLGAGAVIHLIHSNEIDKMGGLRKYMPVTHISFLIACLAIAGIFPFAGFFSKEEILLATYHANRPVFVMALITSGLTAFYMFRLYFSIFWGKSQPTEPHHTEGTATMKIPLIVLMLCTIVVGFLPFSAWVFRGGSPLASHIDWKFSLIPLTLSGVGIVLAAYFYRKPSDRASEWALVFGGIYRAASNKFYIDEVYRWITQQVLFPLIGKPFAWFDKHIVDGTVNGIGTFVGSIYYFIRGMQSGKLQDYLFYFLAGIAAWMIFFFYIWK